MSEVVHFHGALITRQLGQMHRNRIENALERHQTITVDLEGVDFMTPSFADEVFGVLANRLGLNEFKRRIRIRGVKTDLRHLVVAVIGQRIGRERSST